MSSFFKIPLSAEALMQESRRLTGIDIIDEDAIAPLDMLVKSLNESGLHEAGAVAMQRNLLRMLCNRLRMQRDLSKHPEILKQELLPPTVVLGLTRTGSTKLQKLLAATGDFNWLTFWQSLNPSLHTGSKNESPQQRIDDTESFVQWFDRSTPDAKLIHKLNTHEPEEEIFVLIQSLRTFALTAYGALPEFMEWLFTEDLTKPVKFVRDTYKYLQWQGYGDSTKPWMMKCPLYLGLEPAIKAVFPDCKMVMCHRDLNSVVPSTISLFSAYRKPYTDIPFDYRSMVSELGQQLQMHLANRSADPDLNIYDIDYKALTTSSEQVVENIYKHVGVSLSDDARQKIRKWEADNPKHKHGAHRYSLDMFGVSEQDIEASFNDYIKFQEGLF